MRRDIITKVVGIGIIIVFIGTCLSPAVQSSLSEITMPKSSPNTKDRTPFGNRGQFYAYDMTSGYLCTFDLDAVIHNIAAEVYFLAGADMDPDGHWYAVSMMGGLYLIDKDTGSLTYIAYTIPLNTLSYDDISGLWYTSDSLNNFFRINVTTGSTTLIGNFGITDVMTNLMCDANGLMYGFTISSNFHNSLYSVDKTTGAVTFIGDTGIHVTGANFDRNNGTLYLAMFDYSSGVSDLAVCDPATAAVVIINQFNPMDEIVMLVLPYTPVPIINYTITGTQGNDGWYVSNVVITFTAQPPLRISNGPPPINRIYYKLHESDPWTEYVMPITVSEDGYYDLYYYSTNEWGHAGPVKGPFPFKIDKTPPTVSITAIPQNYLKTRWLLLINASDAMSRISLVEIYIDDVLIGNITHPPWQFIFDGSGKIAQVFVYDAAGNNQEGNVKDLNLLLNSQPTTPNAMLSAQQRSLQQY
jgi:hypothetical protein